MLNLITLHPVLCTELAALCLTALLFITSRR